MLTRGGAGSPPHRKRDEPDLSNLCSSRGAHSEQKKRDDVARPKPAMKPPLALRYRFFRWSRVFRRVVKVPSLIRRMNFVIRSVKKLLKPFQDQCRETRIPL